ncbi:hypothetical protein T492DRAFT_901980 [Pavlovales sp. CCMP2436]|nr:hypothetical protein T492DRAFT_901980 [Pavlovales sp. CCMP2436]
MALRRACAWLVALAAVASARPAVVVGELFADLISFHAVGKRDMCLSRRAYRRANAPWLSLAHLLGGTVPTLRELRGTMLSDSFVFNASLRRCVGDPMGLGPPSLCVQGFPEPSGFPKQQFDQYSLEVILLTRWLQEAPICDEDEGSCGARMMPAEFRARSGADAELQRRARLQQGRKRLSSGRDARAAQALLPSAPLMITVPRPVGVFPHDLSWSRSADYKPRPRPIGVLWSANIARNGHLSSIKTDVRERIMRALVAANATCNLDSSRCALCALHAPGCAAPTTTFGECASATVCIEPPGDTHGRSHAVVALATGCIPVLVEGGHPAYPKDEPTWWPWRAAPGPLASASPLRGLTLDYSAFSLLTDGGSNEDSLAATRVVYESLSLAADEQRLSRMRAELARVAPLFLYARRRPPAGAPEDAFERLRKTLAAVLSVHRGDQYR